jgi:hypothetical protein
LITGNSCYEEITCNYCKIEIQIKENPKAEAIKKAHDEVIAMAIRDAMLKEKEKR